MENRKRNIQMKFYVTEEEKRLIDEKMKQLPIKPVSYTHLIINSVNFDTGKKLHMAKEQLQELMRRNDMICQEMGLPVFEPTAQQARGMGGAEYHTALKGQSWKLRLLSLIHI